MRALGRHQRYRCAFDAGQIVHEIVERLECTCCRIAKYLLDTTLRLAGEQRYAYGFGAVEIGIGAAEHADRAGGVEAADADLNAASAQRCSDIERPRKLIRLDPDQHHHAGTGALDHARKASRPDTRVSLVVDVDFNVHIRAENGAFRTILRQSIQRGERIGGDRRTQPLNDVTVFIVMRRLNEHEAETPSPAKRNRQTHTNPRDSTLYP